tara:strand:- start:139 stop:2157 length:2019 start_codon:yes stop_codon:yes gene_type:complete
MGNFIGLNFIILFSIINLYWRLLCLDKYSLQWSVYILTFLLLFAFISPKLLLQNLNKAFIIILFLLIPFFGFHTWHIQNIFWEFLLSFLLYSLAVCSIRSKTNNESKFNITWHYSYFLIAAFIFFSVFQIPFHQLRNHLFINGLNTTLINILIQDASTYYYAISQSFRYILIAILAFQLARFVKEYNYSYKILVALSLGFSISILVSLFDFLKIIEISWVPNPYTKSSLFATTYGNYAWFAQILTSIIPLLFILLLNEKGKKLKLIISAIALISLFVFFSSSRTAILILPPTLLSSYLIFKSYNNSFFTLFRKLFFILPIIILSIFTVIYAVRISEHPALGELRSKLTNFTESERTSIWNNAFQMTKISPMTGYGLGTYRYTNLNLTFLSEISKNFDYFKHDGIWFNDTPHNVYFEWVTGIGHIGLLLLLLHLVSLLVVVYKCKLGDKTKIYLQVLSLLVFITYAFFQEMTYLTSIMILWLWLICSIWNDISAKIDQKTSLISKFLVVQVIFFIGGIILIFTKFDGAIYGKLYNANAISQLRKVDTMGLYSMELWNEEPVYWTQKGLIHPTVIENNKTKIRIQSMSANTHKRKGLEIDFYINDEHIVTHKLTREEMIKTFTLDTSKFVDSEVLFKMRVNRTFNPSKKGNSKDDRQLGVVIHASHTDIVLPQS